MDNYEDEEREIVLTAFNATSFSSDNGKCFMVY